MKVLGIDPGTAVLGFGVVESVPGRPARLVECGILATKARDPRPSRLRVIHDGIAALLARHRPDVMAVESVFYARNARATMVMSHGRGVILLANKWDLVRGARDRASFERTLVHASRTAEDFDREWRIFGEDFAGHGFRRPCRADGPAAYSAIDE